MERRAYHHGDLRDALLDAAEGVLATGREPSLRELAACVGVSPNAPYRHFPDKSALLSAIAERGFQRLGTALTGRDLEEAFGRYLVFARENPATFRLMFRDGSSEAGAPGTGMRLAFEAMTRAVAREMPPGSPVSVSVRGATVAWATVHGCATLALAGSLGETTPPTPAWLAAVVRAGLRNARG